MLSQQRIEGLGASLRGNLIGRRSPEYDAARRVYNGMIDRHPDLIVRCADTADVISAVRAGIEADVAIAVRGGGHNAGGLGICDDGLVVDLSPMHGVRVDPEARTVRVEGGALWRDGEIGRAHV